MRYYALPEIDLELKGLNVIHWGWWIGTFKTNRFEPSHALAMALKPWAVRDSLSFPVKAQELHSYLKGVPFRNEGPKGWVLICVDQYPLGWGKRVNNRIKSYLPGWLRQAW
jgi:NOL1/NOP2/fmu family ribosome biogenesis protein